MQDVSDGQRAGRIEVICGCMFAGKTLRLIDKLAEAFDAGSSVVAFKHVLDDRYDPQNLTTHDRERFDAAPIDDAGQIPQLSDGADVVGIDEAQFFGRPLVGVCRTLADRGQRVIVAGIDHDAWGRPFPPLPQLKQIADDVEALHARCSICGEPAQYSQRLVPVARERMVGGAEAYEPRCPACFEPLPPPAPVY